MSEINTGGGGGKHDGGKVRSKKASNPCGYDTDG